MADKDYRQIVSDLIANAIGSSRVTGENRRITRLVAGSIARFTAELRTDAGNDEARALINHAAALLAESGGHDVVPTLTAAVAAIAGRR